MALAISVTSCSWIAGSNGTALAASRSLAKPSTSCLIAALRNDVVADVGTRVLFTDVMLTVLEQLSQQLGEHEQRARPDGRLFG